MAEQLYWVRKRGEISGPYSVAQLQSLHARGQFARFNEVSLDQVTWKPATSIRGLFPPPTPRGQRPDQTKAEPAPAPPPPPAWSDPLDDGAPAHPRTEFSPAPAVDPSPTGSGPVLQTVCEQVLDTNPEWYYLDRGDNQQGPVSLFDLQRLLDAGEVDASTYACKPGMSEWLAVETLPGLNAPRGRSAGAPRGAGVGLLLAVIMVPLLGLALVGVLGYLAYEGFRNNNEGEGVLYAFLGLIVFLVAGVAAVLLAVIYWRRRGQTRSQAA